MAALTLTACGGGGSSSSPDTPAQGTTAPTTTASNSVRNGTVDANYVQGNLPHYIAFQVGRQATGNASTAQIEVASGAVIHVGGMTLSGAATDIQDIAGSTNWTMGRWRAGTVTIVEGNGASSETTLGASNNSVHYFVGNTLAVLPVSGAYHCGGFRTTSPTLISGSGTPGLTREKVTNSAATLTIDSTDVVIKTGFTITDGSATANPAYEVTITTPSMAVIRGGFLGGGDGALFRLYDAGNGKVQITQGYKATLSNSAGYQGLATWTCSPA